MTESQIVVSSPGRICLFGEHQDYFGLPVIAAAINLRITIKGTPRSDRKFKISLPDVEDTEEFFLDKPITYNKKRNYLKSAVNVLRRQGVDFSSGWDCSVHGTIPINSGTASSSALVVAWVKFLLESSRDRRAGQKDALAELGFSAEVAEFKEPGGRMDHYSSSLGGVVSIHFEEPLKAAQLPNPLEEFVLADFLERKDTTGMLAHIKTHVLDAAARLRKKDQAFNLKTSSLVEHEENIEKLLSPGKSLLKGTLLTRDLTVEGETLLTSKAFSHKEFGRLLNKQQEVLRDYLHISTPKIDRMIETALKAGALGAKGNGSGGGGSMFAYTPGNAREVAEAVEKIGARAFIVRVDEGVRREI